MSLDLSQYNEIKRRREAALAAKSTTQPQQTATAEQSQEGGSVLSNVATMAKNIPTMLVRTVTQPVEFIAKTANTIGDAAARNATIQRITNRVYRGEEAAAARTRFRVQLPFQEEPLIDNKRFSQGHVAREFTGSALEAGLNIYLAMTGLKLFQAGARVATGAAAKGVTEQGAKNAARRFLTKKTAITALKDAGVGGGYGLTINMQDENATAKTMLYSTLIGAGVGIVAPPVFGKTLKVLGKIGGGVIRSGARAVDSTAAKLEADVTARMEGKTPIKNEKSNLLDLTGETPKMDTSTRLRQNAATTLRAIQRTPDIIYTKTLDKFHPVRKFTNWINSQLGTNLDSADAAQVATGRGLSKAEDKLKFEWKATRQKAGEQDWQTAMNYARHLDYLDRIANGDILPNVRVNGKEVSLTPDMVLESFKALEKQLTRSGKVGKVKELVKFTQDFFDKELRDAISSHRISIDEYNAYRAKHPNYAPHSVVEYLTRDEGGKIPEWAPRQGGSGGGLQLTQSGFKATRGGSSSTIENMDVAVERMVQKNQVLNERNRVLYELAAPLKKDPEKMGVRFLRTKEDVIQRRELVKRYRAMRESKAFTSLPEDLQGQILSKVNQMYDQELGTYVSPLMEQLDNIAKALGIKVEIAGTRRSSYRGYWSARSSEGKMNYNSTIRLNAKHGGVNQFTAAHEIGHHLNGMGEGPRSHTLFRDMIRLLGDGTPQYQKMRGEVKNLSFMVRPLEGGEPGIARLRDTTSVASRAATSSAYRNSSEEIFADYMSVYLVDPQLAKTWAPAFTNFWEKNLSGNKAIREAIAEISKIVKQIPETQTNYATNPINLDKLAKSLKDTGLDLTELDLKDVPPLQKNAIVDGFFDMNIKKNREALGLVPRDERPRLVDIPKGMAEISYMNDGIQERVLMPEDVVVALRHLDPDSGNAIMRVLQNTTLGKIVTAPAKAIRGLATGWNITFAALTNPGRDLQTTLINHPTTIGEYGMGILSSIAGNRGVGREELINMYRRALRSGAFVSSINRDGAAGRLVTPMTESWGHKITHPWQFVERIGQTTEESTRLSVFLNEIKKGATDEIAAREARRATVDFSRSGSVIQTFNMVVPFLNARIQGLANVARVMAKDPVAFSRRVMWGASAPATILYARNSKYASYADIPDYEKQRYWIVMVGEHQGFDIAGNPTVIPDYIKLPKGEVQVAASMVVDRVLDQGKREFPTETKDFLKQFFNNVSPVSGDLTSLLPAGVSQFSDITHNRSAFTGKDIVPEYVYHGGVGFESKNLAPKLQYNPSTTSNIAVRIGGMLNVSPAKVDYLLKTGTMNDILRISSISWDSRKSFLENLSNFPYLRTVFGSRTGQLSQDQKQFIQQLQRDYNTNLLEEFYKSTP